MDAIFLGEMNAAGELRGDAWKSLGYDLDGKQTTKDSLDVCILAAGASKTNQVDGIGGRDNAFGSTVMQVFESLNDLLWPPDAGPPYLLEYEVRQGIAQGKFTLQIQIAGLSDDPAQTAVGLAAQVFTSDAFTGMPAFDQTTDWPVQPESLVDSTSIANGARARFASAYVTNGTFVAGTHESVTVPLRIGLKGIAFTLLIHDAIITFDHTDPSTSANGVLDASEFISLSKAIAGLISPSLCGPAFSGITGSNASGQNPTGVSWAIDYAPFGVVFILVLDSGPLVGIGPTLADFKAWAASLPSSPAKLAIDPQNSNLGVFFDAAAIPFNIDIDARTMVILDASVGFDGTNALINSDLARVNSTSP